MLFAEVLTHIQQKADHEFLTLFLWVRVGNDYKPGITILYRHKSVEM